MTILPMFKTFVKRAGFTVLLFFVIYQMYLWTYHGTINGDIQELPTSYNAKAYRTSDNFNSHTEEALFPYKISPSNMLNLWEKKALQQIDEILKDKPNPKMDDPQLIDIIRKMIYKPASSGTEKLSNHIRSTKQADAVLKILKNQTGGFFVECGGLDGERSSNTLYLEQKMNWTGLLVEVDPFFFIQLLGKNRKIHAIHTCLSTINYPAKMHFKESSRGGGVLTDGAGKDVLCLPFFSIMQAMGQKVIDYLSLDVEGQEYNILKTIPFDKLDIRVLSVEYLHIIKGGVEILKTFMSQQGFSVYQQIDYRIQEMSINTHDLIFVKKGMNTE